MNYIIIKKKNVLLENQTMNSGKKPKHMGHLLFFSYYE